MYVFSLSRPIESADSVGKRIVVLIHIKHEHSSVSYRWAIYRKYDRRGHESASGYGPLAITFVGYSVNLS